VANSKNITSGDANILIVGDSGTWKTRFFGTFDPGTVEVADFDKGMASTAGMDIEYETFKEPAAGQTVSEAQRKLGIYPYGEAWPAFVQWLNKIGARLDQGKGPKVVGFDSLSFMSMIAMNKILRDNKWDVPNQGAYGAQQEYLKRILNQVTAWPVRLVCTAHVKRDDNLVTGTPEKLPLLTGQLAGFISAFFDEVYFTDVVREANKPDRIVIRTKQTPQMKQCKSRWNVPDGTPFTWQEIKKFLPEKSV
jgi:hypothetical protein